MIYSTEWGIEINFGRGQPGAVLQRKEKGYWHDYLVDGEPVTNPFDVETVPPGFIGCATLRKV